MKPAEKPAPQAHTESRDGHTWQVTSWGYATRNCSFGLQCECRQPAATPAKPTPITAARPPRTRRTATPAENEERQFAREFLSDLEEKPPRTRRAANLRPERDPPGWEGGFAPNH